MKWTQHKANAADNPPKLPPEHPGRVRGDGDDTRTGSFPVVRRHPPRGFGSQSTRIKVLTSILVALMCALLGFGYVVQVHNTKSTYEGLSEDELVRLLDETSNQVDKLEERRSQLSQQLTSIQSAADKQQEAARIAQQNEQSSGILAGHLPAKGKGVLISIEEGNDRIDAATLFTLIEELRNAGAEVISFNDVRVVTSTYLKDTKEGVKCDDKDLHSPYEIDAIGDPDALQNAVQIAGGVGSRIKVQFHASVSVQQSNSVKIDQIRKPQPYQYAQTVE
ncbi:membrane protein [Bombiscardovia nodaiensis]|uniref:Membrane protein n=1 Tax=Bombiscardovia nodaiensis TaxID=2932181 RepID=A0ABN6SCR8_9BIFI|nr:membrane protein [Bombiscardovia nodaiensis]